MIKIILNGCSGKMGRIISEVAKNFSNLSIVAGIDKNSSIDMGYPIFSSIYECDVSCDVLLDFSRPEALNDLLCYSKKNSTAIVICTTGFSKDELNKIKEESSIIPIFKSANMSIGINLINNLLKKVTSTLYNNYDIEIIEKHHNQKVDSPSGTALLLGNTIKDSINEETEFVKGRDGNKKREHKEIGIHAVRGGSIVGEHQVIFAGQGEIIEFKHSALSREVFAVGALKACEFMYNKSSGLYSMDDILNF